MRLKGYYITGHIALHSAEPVGNTMLPGTVDRYLHIIMKNVTLKTHATPHKRPVSIVSDLIFQINNPSSVMHFVSEWEIARYRKNINGKGPGYGRPFCGGENTRVGHCNVCYALMLFLTKTHNYRYK